MTTEIGIQEAIDKLLAAENPDPFHEAEVEWMIHRHGFDEEDVPGALEIEASEE